MREEICFFFFFVSSRWKYCTREQSTLYAKKEFTVLGGYDDTARWKKTGNAMSVVLHHVHAQFVAILQRRTIRAAIIINMKLGIPSMTTALTIESEHAPPRHTHIPAATQALAQGLASARHFSAFILPFLVLVMRLTMRRRRNSDGAHLTEIISEVAEKEKKTGWVDLTSHSAVATRENRECMDICG